MSEAATLWLFGAIIAALTTVISGMAGWIFVHSRDCRDFRVDTSASLSAILANLERVREDIGDHDSGMRGDIHDLRDKVMPFVLMQSMQMEQKQK